MVERRQQPYTSARRAQGIAEEVAAGVVEQVRDGILQGPNTPLPATQTTHAGGTNDFPNADQSYSTLAWTVAGTLPGDPGDLNFECYAFYRQAVGADITEDAAHALKSVGHSLYAANEGMDGDIPIWDRVNGWTVMGSSVDQFDIAVKLKGKIVSAGDIWSYVTRIAALIADELVPQTLQMKVGIWEIRNDASQGYLEGGAFTIDAKIFGTPGAVSSDYFVIALNGAGTIGVASQVLTVPNVPDTLSGTNYVRLRMLDMAESGLTQFRIYKKTGTVFQHLFTVFNSLDLFYFDTGVVTAQIEAFPTEPETKPQAVAVTGGADDLVVASFNSVWALNLLRIKVPSTYNITNCASQWVRLTFTEVTPVDRLLGVDRHFFGTTFNAWSLDVLPRFADNSYPIISVSPTSGNQGGGSGVPDPPNPGGGGGCLALDTQVDTGNPAEWRLLKDLYHGLVIPGPDRGYEVLDLKPGTVGGHYVVTTENGISWRASPGQRIVADPESNYRMSMDYLRVGNLVMSYIDGVDEYTHIASIEFRPEPLEVVTPVLRDVTGQKRDGHGVYRAGNSEKGGRYCYFSNVKPQGNIE